MRARCVARTHRRRGVGFKAKFVAAGLDYQE
jgi:hypothetical protein